MLPKFFKHNVQERRGFVLLTTAIAVVALIGAVGVAIDVSRAFVTKSEIQVYSDSAALAATMDLDGTSAGIQRAINEVGANTNNWNLGTSKFSGSQVLFAQSPSGPWYSTVTSPNGYKYARVVADVSLPMLFLPVTSSSSVTTGQSALILLSSGMDIKGDSAAGQNIITYFNDGLFPFSPFAQSTTGPHYGLTVGQQYTLRWGSNPKLNSNTCAGDNTQAMIDLSSAGGGSERGYYQETSATVIRNAIEYDSQVFQVQVGQSITMTGGAKETEYDALLVRIAEDTDTTSESYEDYVSGGKGNGRRLVGVPINTGNPNYTVVQIGAFFLLPASEYDKGGNSPFCAEYVGAWVKGAKTKGASDSGAYMAELVQ